jgi:serine/threonine-protein kinase RsbW
MANHSAWIWTTDVRLPSSRSAAHQLLGELLAALESDNWDRQEIFGVHLAMEEALVNAIRHGNGWDEKKQVHVACKLTHEFLIVEIADEGGGFQPEKVPDCTSTENLHRPGGRGIMLMRNYMTSVEYTHGGHRVVMEKHRSSAGLLPRSANNVQSP